MATREQLRDELARIAVGILPQADRIAEPYRRLYPTLRPVIQDATIAALVEVLVRRDPQSGTHFAEHLAAEVKRQVLAAIDAELARPLMSTECFPS